MNHEIYGQETKHSVFGSSECISQSASAAVVAEDPEQIFVQVETE